MDLLEVFANAVDQAISRMEIMTAEIALLPEPVPALDPHYEAKAAVKEVLADILYNVDAIALPPLPAPVMDGPPQIVDSDEEDGASASKAADDKGIPLYLVPTALGELKLAVKDQLWRAMRRNGVFITPEGFDLYLTGIQRATRDQWTLVEGKRKQMHSTALKELDQIQEVLDGLWGFIELLMFSRDRRLYNNKKGLDVLLYDMTQIMNKIVLYDMTPVSLPELKPRNPVNSDKN